MNLPLVDLLRIKSLPFWNEVEQDRHISSYDIAEELGCPQNSFDPFKKSWIYNKELEGHFHYEFLPPGKTNNSDLYRQQLIRLRREEAEQRARTDVENVSGAEIECATGIRIKRVIEIEISIPALTVKTRTKSGMTARLLNRKYVATQNSPTDVTVELANSLSYISAAQLNLGNRSRLKIFSSNTDSYEPIFEVLEPTRLVAWDEIFQQGSKAG
ncbi:hypothetical protein EVAR_58753_1 [Eumeta japonica]|uniref:Uncharacterized protein n=1 Tax=Eumeta variegata TaxID=151549 RepID=A0A4C1ZD91_EUMVA|nr:hypothetical protein EVAR_58753_1 [Eumeta japonica]